MLQAGSFILGGVQGQYHTQCFELLFLVLGGAGKGQETLSKQMWLQQDEFLTCLCPLSSSHSSLFWLLLQTGVPGSSRASYEFHVFSNSEKGLIERTHSFLSDGKKISLYSRSLLRVIRRLFGTRKRTPGFCMQNMCSSPVSYFPDSQIWLLSTGKGRAQIWESSLSFASNYQKNCRGGGWQNDNTDSYNIIIISIIIG